MLRQSVAQRILMNQVKKAKPFKAVVKNSPQQHQQHQQHQPQQRFFTTTSVLKRTTMTKHSRRQQAFTQHATTPAPTTITSTTTNLTSPHLITNRSFLTTRGRGNKLTNNSTVRPWLVSGVLGPGVAAGTTVLHLNQPFTTTTPPPQSTTTTPKAAEAAAATTTTTTPPQTGQTNQHRHEMHESEYVTEVINGIHFYFEHGAKFPTLPQDLTIRNAFCRERGIPLDTPGIEMREDFLTYRADLLSAAEARLESNPHDDIIHQKQYDAPPLITSFHRDFSFQSTSPGSPVGFVFETLPPGVDRVLMVGDLHGCYDELLELLKSVEFDPHHDMLILLGDLLGKGPKSLEIVDFVMNLQNYVQRTIDTPAIPRNPNAKWLQNHFSQSNKFYRGYTWQTANNRTSGSVESSTDTDDNHNNTSNTCHPPSRPRSHYKSMFYNALKKTPHYNTRVHCIVGNHEAFVINYLNALNETWSPVDTLPQVSPMKSQTHLEVARHLFSIPTPLFNKFNKDDPQDLRYFLHTHLLNYQKNLPKDQETTAALTAHVEKQLKKHGHVLFHSADYIPPLPKFVDELVDVYQYYIRHDAENAARRNWLRSIPDYIFLKELNSLCVHAGVPPTLLKSIDGGENVLQQVNDVNSDVAQNTPNAQEEPLITTIVNNLHSTARNLFFNVRGARLLKDNTTFTLPPSSTQPQQQQSTDTSSTTPPPLSSLSYQLATKAKGEMRLWSEVYCDVIHQYQLEDNAPHVFFGHDAATGLQLNDFTTGLDTGSVYGGALSGILFEKPEDVRDKKYKFEPDSDDTTTDPTDLLTNKRYPSDTGTPVPFRGKATVDDKTSFFMTPILVQVPSLVDYSPIVASTPEEQQALDEKKRLKKAQKLAKKEKKLAKKEKKKMKKEKKRLEKLREQEQQGNESSDDIPVH